MMLFLQNSGHHLHDYHIIFQVYSNDSSSSLSINKHIKCDSFKTIIHKGFQTKIPARKMPFRSLIEQVDFDV